MSAKLTRLKRADYEYSDRKARHLAYKMSRGESVGRLLLRHIEELYLSAQGERDFVDNHFEMAYHNPISSELEFLIARLL